MKKSFWVILLFAVSMAAIIMPTLGVKRNDPDPYMLWLMGTRGDYKGMLRLWNVSPNGEANVSRWLRSAADEFEKRNFGVFIDIETMSAEKFAQKMAEGDYPDLVAHCTGTFDNHKLFEELDSSAAREPLSMSGEGYAVPLAMDAGVLLVNDGYLMEREIEAPEGSPDISWIARQSEALTFTAQGQKGDVEVNGLAMAADAAALAYGWPPSGWREAPAVRLSDTKREDAVTEFAEGKLGMIFCPISDYKRIYAKSLSGECPAFLSFALNPVSTKAHYISSVKSGDGAKGLMKTKFIDNLLLEETQSGLADAYQLPSVKIPYIFTEDEALSAVEKAFEGDVSVPRCFLKKEALDYMSEVSLNALLGNKESVDILNEVYKQTLVMP